MEFLLSDIRRDANGSVFYVGATMLTWLLENDPTVWRHSFRSDWLFYDLLPVFYRMPVFTPCGRRISSTRRSTATLHYPMTSDCIRWHPAGKNGRHPPQLCKGRTCNIFKNYVKRMCRCWFKVTSSCRRVKKKNQRVALSFVHLSPVKSYWDTRDWC